MPPTNSEGIMLRLCECTRLCSGGRYIQPRTWYRHRKYQEKDQDEEREAQYERVTGMPYPHPRINITDSQSRLRGIQVRPKAYFTGSGPDRASFENEPSLDANPPSPTRGVERDTIPEDNAGHYYPSDDIDEGEQTRDDADFANDNLPQAPSSHLPIDLSDWNEPPEPQCEPDVQGEEGDNGQDEGQDGAGPDNEDGPFYPQTPTQPDGDGSLPQATYPMLVLAQKMVESINNATLEDDIRDLKSLHSNVQGWRRRKQLKTHGLPSTMVKLRWHCGLE